jgi:hypothetical protein
MMMKAKKKLYILLTDTGTWLSRTIKLYTREPLNHASLAFDSQLCEVYSFGRKYEGNPFLGGFVRENIRSRLFLNRRRQTPCAIYVCEVEADAYARIREWVLQMARLEHAYKYNALGLFGVALGFKIERENAYFCSQFVASAFLAGGVKLTDKEPAFVTPADLGRSDRIRLVYKGTLQEYPPLYAVQNQSERAASGGFVRLVGMAEAGSSGQ